MGREPQICLEMHYMFLWEAFLVDRERWCIICTFLVRRKRYLCIFHLEDIWVPPGRFRVFRPLDSGLPNKLSPIQVKSVSLEKQQNFMMFSGICCVDIFSIPMYSLWNEILHHWSWQELKFLLEEEAVSRKFWENEENLSRERKSRQNHKWQISFVLGGSGSRVWNAQTRKLD